MKHINIFGAIFALGLILMLSGCISQNKQQDLTDGNWMKNSETSGNEIVEDIYSDTEEKMNTIENSNAELKDNEIKHCVCHLNQIQYNYWIAKEELARDTLIDGKVRQTITKIENCAYQEGIPKQCSPLDFDFEQMKNEWLNETESMNCTCNIIEYESKYFK